MSLALGVQELFPTPIWTVDLPPDRATSLNAMLEREILALIDPRPELPLGTNWQTDPILHELPQFRDLVKLLMSSARAVVEFLKLRPKELAITGCWANVNPPGGRNSVHTHPNNFLSAVYYVSIPEGEGRIVFEDPRPQAHVVMPPVAAFSKFTGNNVTFDVKPGRLVLFPAWLGHSVPTNQSGADRISIATNIMFKNYVEEASPPLWRGTVRLPPAG